MVAGLVSKIYQRSRGSLPLYLGWQGLAVLSCRYYQTLRSASNHRLRYRWGCVRCLDWQGRNAGSEDGFSVHAFFSPVDPGPARYLEKAVCQNDPIFLLFSASSVD